MENHSPNSCHMSSEAEQLACEFARRVEHAVEGLQQLLDITSDNDGWHDHAVRHLLLALLNLPHVRITLVTASLGREEFLSTQFGSAIAAQVELQLDQLCGGDESPWTLNKVEVTDEHRFARWQDVQERCRTAGIAGCDDDQETRVVDVAVFMISNGRWPERVLQPVLESILVHCDPEHKPEVVAVLCDRSSQRLQLDCRLLDLQCTHIRSRKTKLAVGSEKNRDDLCREVASWGTLHCAADRDTNGGLVMVLMLPLRFSERLLVLAALIRAVYDTSYIVATPGPWIETLIEILLPKLIELCVIDGIMCTVSWLDAQESYRKFGIRAHQFSDGERLSFDASSFDALTPYGPGAAERLVGSMARLGIINMQHLALSLTLSDIALFGSYTHGVRIVGSCPEHFVARRGTGGHDVPAFLPEILDVIGARLLNRYLLSKNNRLLLGAPGNDPVITTWHHIWALLRETIVSLAQGRGSALLRQRLFAIFMNTTRARLRDILCKVSKSEGQQTPPPWTYKPDFCLAEEDISSAPALPVEASISHPDEKEGILCELVLDVDFGLTIGAEESFKRAIALDLAHAAGGNVDQFKVLRLRAGSVIAEFMLCRGLDTGRSPIDTFYFLKKQEKTHGSLLLQGEVTRKTQELRIKRGEPSHRSVTNEKQIRGRKGTLAYCEADSGIPVQVSDKSDETRQDFPPPGEEPGLEGLRLISRQTVCYIRGTEEQVREKFSHPQLSVCCCDLMHADDDPEPVRRDLEVFSRGVAVQLSAVETQTQSFVDAVSFAVRGCQDEDGIVCEGLEVASSHADSYVGRQWAHRNTIASKAIGSSMPTHSVAPKLFTSPVTVASMRQETANVFEDDESHNSENRRVWAHKVYPLHLLITANTLRRPVIVLEPESFSIRPAEQDDSTSLKGVYLPLSCSPDTCIADPIVLLHKPDGFDLAGVKDQEVRWIQTLSAVCLPPRNIESDQWFAPIIPQLPDEGDSVPIVMKETLPLHYFLEDEGHEETLRMYLCSLSVEMADGQIRRIIRYPILQPVCTSEVFAKHKNIHIAGPESTDTAKDVCTAIAKDDIIPGTISGVLAHHAGQEALPLVTALSDAQYSWKLSNWLHLQWFSMLWNRDHPDDDTCAHLKTKADAEAAVQKKYAYAKAAWAKKEEEMAAAKKKYEADVAEKKKKDPKYDETADKKQHDDALAAAEKQLAGIQFNLQWFSMLWNRNNPDDDTGAHVKRQADAAAVAQKKYAHAKAAWAKKQEEMAAAKKKYEADVAEKKKKDPKYDETVDRKNNDDALAAEKKKNNDALAAAEEQLAVETGAAKAMQPAGMQYRQAERKKSAENMERLKYLDLHLPHFSFPAITGPDLLRFDFAKWNIPKVNLPGMPAFKFPSWSPVAQTRDTDKANSETTNRDHPDADAGAHVMGNSNSAYEIDLQKGAMQPMGMQYRQAEAEAAAHKKYAHAKAAWAKKQEEMAAAKKKYEADVAEKKKKDPKYDETVDRKNNDDALAAEKKKNNDALAAAEEQLAVETGAAKAMQPAGIQYRQAERKKGTENMERLKYLDLHLPHFSFPAITGPDLPRFDFPKRSCLNRIVDEEAKADRSDRHSNRGRALHVDEKDGIKILCAEKGIELIRNSYAGPCGENVARDLHLPHFSFPAITGPDLQRVGFPKRGSLNRMVDEHFIMDGTDRHFKRGAGISECSVSAGDKDVEIEDLKERIKAAEARLRSLGVEGKTADLRYVDPQSKVAAWNNMFNFPKMNLNLHLPGMPKLKFPSWQSNATGERSSDATATQMTSKDEEEDRNTAQGEAAATRRVWGRPRGGIMGVTQFDKEGRPSGCLGFSMKAKTPPETDRYSVIIDKVTPGTSASIAGEVAVNDEILEIHGQDVKDLYDDLPDADVLMSRINAKLAESTDFVTIKVLQEDGLINSFRLLRAETILPNIQHLTDGETGVELEASGKHVVIKRILDGSPAFFSFVLATGQRVLSINFQRTDVKYLEEYEGLRFGTVGTRVTYVVDTRTEYPDDDDHQHNVGIARSAQWAKLPSVVSWNTTGGRPRTTDGYIVETEDQKGAREDEEWFSIIDDAKPLMLPIVRQVLMNNQERKMVETFRKANSPFFLTARGGPDITALKKLIVKAKPKPIEPSPPKKPMEREPPLPPPPKKEAPPKKPRAPPPKKEAPPRRTPPPPPPKKVPPPPQTPPPPYDHLSMASIPQPPAKKVAPSPPEQPPAPTKKIAPTPQTPPPPYDHLSMASIPQPPAKKVAPSPPKQPPAPTKKIAPTAKSPPPPYDHLSMASIPQPPAKKVAPSPPKQPPAPTKKTAPSPKSPPPPYDHLSMASIPQPPAKKVAPPPPTPKSVGIGMKIGESCPHAITGFAKGGASAECGLIFEGDKLLQVDGNDVKDVSMDECSKYILGPEGSEIQLKFSRPPPPPPPRPVKKIDPPKLVGVGLMLEIKKTKNGALVHFVGGVAPGAAAESGQIAVGDLLLVVNGKDCSKLDGKQVQAIVLGLEGSPITMEFLRGNPEVATPRSDNERFQVDLIRGGSEYKKRLEDGEMAYNKMIEQYEKQYPPAEPELVEVKLFRGGSEGKKRVQAELEAHRKLAQSVEEENMQAEVAYKRKLEEVDKAYKILVERIEEENLQADATHKKKNDDNQNAYMKLVEQIEEENAKAEAAYKRKLEEEAKAYKILVERIEEENLQADATHKKKNDDNQNAYMKLVEQIEEENSKAEAAYKRKLEEEDKTYKILVERIEEENLQADAAHKKKIDDNQNAYMKLVERIEEENAQAEAAYKKKLKDEGIAYKRLVQRFDEENVKADAAHKQKLQDEDAAYQKLLEDIEKENQQAEAAFFRSLESDDEEYKQLVKRVEEENQIAEETYNKELEAKEAAYQRKIQEDEAAYKRQVEEIEEVNRLEIAWWEYGSDIDPPRKGQTDIEVILDLDIKDIVGEFECEEDVKQISLEYFHGVRVMDKTQKALLDDFKRQLCAELAEICKAHADEMKVVDLQKGSIISRIRLQENVGKVIGKSAAGVAQDLCKQAEFDWQTGFSGLSGMLRSKLYTGKLGSKVISIRVLPDGKPIQRPLKAPEHPGIMDGAMGSLISWKDGAIGFRSFRGPADEIKDSARSSLSSVQTGTGGLGLSDAQPIQSNPASGLLESVAASAKMPFVFGGSEKEELKGTTLKQGGRLFGISNGSMTNSKSNGEQGQLELQESAKSGALGGFWGSMKSQTAGIFAGGSTTTASAGLGWAALPSVVSWNTGGRVPVSTYNLKRDNQAEMSTPAGEVFSGPIQSSPAGGRVPVSTYNLNRDNQAEMSTPAGEVFSGPIQSSPAGGRVPVSTYNLNRDNQAEMSTPAGEVFSGPIQSNPASRLLESVVASAKMPFVFGGSEKEELKGTTLNQGGRLFGISNGSMTNSKSNGEQGQLELQESAKSGALGGFWGSMKSQTAGIFAGGSKNSDAKELAGAAAAAEKLSSHVSISSFSLGLSSVSTTTASAGLGWAALPSVVSWNTGGRVPVSTYNLKRDNQAEMSTPAGEVFSGPIQSSPAGGRVPVSTYNLNRDNQAEMSTPAGEVFSGPIQSSPAGGRVPVSTYNLKRDNQAEMSTPAGEVFSGPIQSNPASRLLESVVASAKMPFVFGGSEKEELKGTTLNQGGRLFGISNGSMTNSKSNGEQGQLELQESAKSGALGGFWGSMKSQTAGIFAGGSKNSDAKELAGAAAAAEKLSSHVSIPSLSFPLFPIANKEGVRGTPTQSDTGSDVRFGMSDTQAGATPCLRAAEGVEIHSTSATSTERRKVEDLMDNSGYAFVQRKDKQNRASQLVKREHEGLPFHPETLEFLPGNLEKMPDRLAECAGSTDRNTTVELAFLMGCLPDICSINRDQRLRIDKDTRLQPDFSRLPMCYLETIGFISTRHEERMPERPENPMAFMQDLETSLFKCEEVQVFPDCENALLPVRCPRANLVNQPISWKRPITKFDISALG